MASIVKRKSKFSVVYNCVDENGVKRQKWETFGTHTEAKKRKSEIEYLQLTGDFIVPTAKTLRDLLTEYVSIYGVNTWALSTYEARRSKIDNYINPIIGDVKLDDINPRFMDKYFKQLSTMKPTQRPYLSGVKQEFVTPRTIKDIHKLLRSAFNQAVKWELMSRNPVEHATLPKCESKKRDIWTADILFKAISLCEDDVLKLALNLAFSCSLRMGEMLGLTWDCIDISDDKVENNTAFIYVEKELQRVYRTAVTELDGKDIMKIFPAITGRANTCLVLKTPKTQTSARKIFLPKTVAEMLKERKKVIDEYMEIFGYEYNDHNLVFCNTLGNPIEGQLINRGLSKLIKDHNLPKVVFHSLRHSSITYKLKLNGGDMKAVQGDSGHAQVKMVADVYSHIIDDDRRLNAEIFEKTFYSSETTNEEKPTVTDESSEKSDQELLLQLLAKSPDLVNVIKALAKTI